MTSRLKSADGFYGWVNLVVMFFFNIVFMMMMLSFALFLPSWVEEFSWNRGTMSLAQAVAMILTGLAAPLVGIFIMKKGVRTTIILGNLILIAGLILVSFQQHIWQLFLGYGVLVGLGMSLGGMLAMMTVINNWFIIKRPMALSISMAAMGFGGIVFNPLLMMLINSIGWRNTYLVIAAAAFLFCVLSPALLLVNKPEDLGQVPDGPHSSKNQNAESTQSIPKNLYKTPVDFTAKEALMTRTMWLLIGYVVVQFTVMQILMTHQFNFFIDMGFADTSAAFAFGVFGFMMGTSQLGVGFLGLKIKMHSLAVASIIFGLAGLTILIFARSMGLVILCNVLIGIGIGIQGIALGNLIPDYFGRTEFPKMMGYTMPFTTFLSAIGSPVAGYIRDATGSYIPAFQFAIAALILGFIFIIFAKPPIHPSLEMSHA
ncbi:MAG: MFS transporter [Deltaproteobacteria bacterium]|nr:MFS transporter [Deltaproteobacteria bacterium]